MVNANTTRATLKKIKDFAASKNRSNDISVANALTPTGGNTQEEEIPMIDSV
jgi:hypothetical protein